MSQWDTGRWVSVDLPDGSSRYDWIPDNQPPSPDGSPGVWHGVGEPGMPGVWEWHPAAPPVPVAPPPVVEPVVVEPVVVEPVVPEPVVPEPVVAETVVPDRPNPWVPTTEIQPEPATGGPRRFAHPGVIITGVIAAVVAGVAVLSLVLQDDDDDEKQTVTSSQPSTPEATPDPTPSATTTATAPDDADLDFPKVSGDWTLYDVDLVENSQGLFSGTGKIGYDGSKMGATANFTLTIYSEGKVVGTMTAGTSAAKPRTSTQVTWESSSTWVEDPDGYTFSAR